MMLTDFILPSRVNQTWKFTGIDSVEQCKDLAHFKSYPYPIEYNYNSRGFRDSEWPNFRSDFEKSIWCVGDSFTVGIGSPIEHTWPYLLQQATSQRTINVSMDGASNNWISRKVVRILEEIRPDIIVIHWSFAHRGEVDPNNMSDRMWNQFYAALRGPGWPECDRLDFDKVADRIPDDARLLHHCRRTNEDDLDNTLECISRVNKSNVATKVIHSFVPDFIPHEFRESIKSQVSLCIPEIKNLDLARDGFHYDIITSSWLVGQIQKLL